MFFYGNIEEFNREQHNDRLRRTEYDRLVRNANMTNTGPGFWHHLHRVLYTRLRKMEPAREKTRLPEQIRTIPTVAKQG